MPHTLVLMSSPMLGPAAWLPVEDALRDRGREVLVASAARTVTPADVLDAYTAAIPANMPVVLVPHSNAGLYVPALTTRRDVAGAVFVDAGLPEPHGATPVAPPEFKVFLESIADNAGLLPPWTGWWAESDMTLLVPDERARVEVERDQTRLPLSYFDDVVDVPAGWDSIPAAYLAFGDSYADERAAAERRGWPTMTVEGNHLHMLVDPAGVADAIESLEPAE